MLHFGAIKTLFYAPKKNYVGSKRLTVITRKMKVNGAILRYSSRKVERRRNLIPLTFPLAQQSISDHGVTLSLYI